MPCWARASTAFFAPLIRTCSGAKLFPAFRGYLTSHAGDADEAEKRAAVVAELKLINDYLSQAGKVRGEVVGECCVTAGHQPLGCDGS